MGTHTTIAWTEATWTTITGCTRASPGCQHCYAERLVATRLQTHPKYTGLAAMTPDGPHWTGQLRFSPDVLPDPLRWRQPRRIFVNSMSDTFHEQVPEAWIDQVFAVMALAPRHTFQVLTKRAARLSGYCQGRDWSEAANVVTDRYVRRLDEPLYLAGELIPPLPNVWLGVSVESAAYLWRVDLLRQVPAALRFLSLEPLLGPLPDLDLTGLGWVIVGGESGPGARPMDLAWLAGVVQQCQAAQVPVFVKQASGPRPGRRGPIPDALWVQQFPPPAGDARGLPPSEAIGGRAPKEP